MNLPKNSRFSTDEAVNYILRTEKCSKVAVCEMLKSYGSFPSSMLPILSLQQEIIAYRDRYTIPTSSKLGWFCQYLMIS